MATSTTTTAPAATGYWLSDALSALGAWAGAYANNKLAYESAKDELALYEMKLLAEQRVAAQTAQLQGGSLGTVAGVPTGAILIAAVAAVGLIAWAAR